MKSCKVKVHTSTTWT